MTLETLENDCEHQQYELSVVGRKRFFVIFWVVISVILRHVSTVLCADRCDRVFYGGGWGISECMKANEIYGRATFQSADSCMRQDSW